MTALFSSCCLRTVRSAPLLGLSLFLLLGGCASSPRTADTDPALIKEAMRGVEDPAPDIAKVVPAESRADTRAEPQQQLITGRQRFGEGRGAANPAATAASDGGNDGDGDIVFNFTDQPIEAVINTVMGDLLHENYSIADGVKGQVSFSTSRPVNSRQALSILETLLSWTGNAMIQQQGRYVILPADQAVAGKLVPQLPISQPPAGLSARLYPLRYIGAEQMQKLLKPFVRDSALLLVDPAHNVIGLAGTPQELANYQDTIDTFDVDWLKGMSLAVYGLQRASVSELMPQLQEMMGAKSDLPLSSMVKFLPNVRNNSIIAISSQPDYLREVGEWIRAIDEGGGNEPQLYVYDVRNMKASDLAGYLRQIYGGDQEGESSSPAEISPGLSGNNPNTLNESQGVSIMGGTPGLSGTGPQGMSQSVDDGGFSSSANEDANTVMDSPRGDGTSGSGGTTLGSSIRITAQKSSNQLLVRARPAQWKEIESAIQRLDHTPRQVQIETRILEVRLTGQLDMGVQWYLGRLAGNSGNNGVANESGSQAALGAGGAAVGNSSTFYSFVSDNLQVALRALERKGLTQVLSAPSLVVLNNQKAQIQVGDNVPISQTSVNTINSDTTLSSVEYVQTGVILDVIPRINPGGLVYMDIHQQVSDAGDQNTTTSNPRISTRSVATQVAVQSGQTVLLGGLIQQNNSQSSTRVPWLSSIPGLGWLFGSDSRGRDRTELIVLITPRVVNDPQEAREITNDYRQQMQILKASMTTPNKSAP